ncbi:TPA: tail fiber protein, partial [Enterobacter cloacae]|nr:tail fiber protein [Enterobacter cloacae]
ATTAFVKSALAALVGSSPAALDTLNELAAALGNDPNFATTMTNALAGKQPLDSTLTTLSGKTADGIIEYLDLGEGSALPVGVPIPWPSATPPTGWIKCNGAAFTASQYPKLAQAYPALRLPDLRGEFIRGLDDGRGVDSGRTILSSQYGSLVVGDDGISSITPFVINNLSDISVWGYDQKPSGLPSNLYTIRATPVSGVTNTDTSGIIAMSRPRNIAFNYIVRAA